MTTDLIVSKGSPWKRHFGWSALALTGIAAYMHWRNSSRRSHAEHRVLCSELLPIRWQEGADSFETIANLEEIWTSGAIIAFEEKFTGGEITIVTPSKEFTGTVVATWHDETGHFVELRFRLSDMWSIDVFEPEHAFDLATITPRIERADSVVRTSVRLVEVSR